MKVKLVSVYVDDQEKALPFYTEVLGFVPTMVVPEASLAVVVAPEDPDGAALNLEPTDNPIASTYQQALYREGLPLIVFGVEDIEAECARLRQSGVRFTQEPSATEYGTVADFDDTCGNLIRLFQDPERP